MKIFACLHGALLALLCAIPNAQAGGYGYGGYYGGHSYYQPSYSYQSYGGYGQSYYGSGSGWSYIGNYYAPGAQWYGPGYWGGKYYYAGYWIPPAYKPYLVPVPVAFTTYQPAAVVSKQLGAIEQRAEVQATGTGVAGVLAVPTVNVGTLAVTAPAAQAVAAASLEQVIAELVKVNQRLARLEQSPRAEPRAEAKAKPANDRDAALMALAEKGKAVFVAQCAKCHSKGDSEKPQLFNGNEPRQLDSQLLADCDSAVWEGRMPPTADGKESAMKPEDMQALKAYFVVMSKANRRDKMPAAK